jgi:VCBS repeat-containing protein
LPNQNPTGTFTVTESSSTNLGAFSVASAAGTIDVSDLDGDTSFTYVVSGSLPIAPTIGTSTKGGVVVINGDGTFDYTSPLGLPHSSAPGGTTDTFTVTVLDGYGGTAEVVVTVPIASVNNNPTHVGTIANPLNSRLLKDASWVTTVSDLTDLDVVTAAVTTGPSRGNVGISAASSAVGTIFTISYSSTGSRTGFPIPQYPTDSFTITFSDGHGGVVVRSYNY